MGEEPGCSGAEGSSVQGEEEDMEDTLSQMSDLSQEAGQEDAPSYSIKDINDFLDVTYGKKIDNVQDFFPDLDAFLNSVKKLKKQVGIEQLNQKKRYRLSKLVGRVKKEKEGKRLSKTD